LDAGKGGFVVRNVGDAWMMPAAAALRQDHNARILPVHKATASVVSSAKRP